MIQVYGQYHDEDDGGCGLLPALDSPLFCGMSFVMLMPQFNISLIGPTSTTTHIEVATNFSGDGGIIIEFDTTKGDAQNALGFDVSWISRYGWQEDERYESIQ